ncbi:caspase family protein [Methylobacterium sp. CM6241]
MAAFTGGHMIIYKRYALILGNAEYSGRMKLESPAHDAKHVGGILKSLNFDCTEKYNLTSRQIKDEFNEFVLKLSENAAEVALIYYSGHGLSNQDKNYILPIDFDTGEIPVIDKIIEIKPEIDRISNYSTVRLVFLDACRNNPNAPKPVKTKGLDDVVALKAIFSGNQEIRVSGLSEMKADRNTFIAFAAAPGGYAYDGSIKFDHSSKVTLSPFTAALARHFESVDLPLSNLMSRVRKEVYEITGRMQITWDQSSLDDPFYFSPGSTILYIGNIMALVGLFISFIQYSLVISSGSATGTQTIIASLLPLLSLAILLYGMQSVYSRIRGNQYERDFKKTTVKDHLRLSLEKGVIGGYLGALLGSIWIAVPYYYSWVKAAKKDSDLDAPGSLGGVMTEVSIATALVACLLGALCFFATRITIDRRQLGLLQSRTPRRTVVSSAMGGIVSGIIAAPMLMWYFGRMARPEVTPEYLLPGAVLGSSILIFAIVNFDYERLNKDRIYHSMIAALISLLYGIIITLAMFVPLYVFGIVQFVIKALREDFDNFAVMTAGSIAYGIPVGCILGIVIGYAIVLTEKRSAKPVI